MHAQSAIAGSLPFKTNLTYRIVQTVSFGRKNEVVCQEVQLHMNMVALPNIAHPESMARRLR